MNTASTALVAMDFADKHKGTLVIVTADHETGGLSIMNGNKAKKEIIIFAALLITLFHKMP